MNDKEREEQYAANSQFLRSNDEFMGLPPRFQELVLKSPNASADYKDFFAHGGRIIPDPNESLAAYRAEPKREIHVNQGQYEFAKTREGAHLVGDLFSRMAHEIGHDKDRNTPFPPSGAPDTAEAYVQFRSEKEAKAIFNAFPIFSDLEKNEPSFVKNNERNWDGVGYSVMGLNWPRLYDKWKSGNLDDTAAIKEIAKVVADYPYTRTDGLTDQNQDGRLTQRDLYLRDYQGLLRHQQEPGTPSQSKHLNDGREPDHPAGIQQGRQAFSTGDPDLDRLAVAIFSNDEAAISRVNAQIEQSPQVQAYAQWGRELVAFEQNQQQEMARQVQGPVMTR